MEAIRFKYRGEGLYITDEQHWGDSYGWYYPKDEVDAVLKRIASWGCNGQCVELCGTKCPCCIAQEALEVK